MGVAWRLGRDVDQVLVPWGLQDIRAVLAKGTVVALGGGEVSGRWSGPCRVCRWGKQWERAGPLLAPRLLPSHTSPPSGSQVGSAHTGPAAARLCETV